MIKKICLFTAHSPSGGGGSVILRSLIHHLGDINIIWKYISKTKVTGYEDGHLGSGFMGTSIINDIWQSYNMLADHRSPAISKIVNELLAVECDGYWIVSHNEGLRVAIELARAQSTRPVHLTIHDDWSGALSARSFRYRFLSNAAKKMTIKALTEVTHFDVISKGMQKYYEGMSGLKGEVCHRYLPLASLRHINLNFRFRDEINVGHIGSVYSKKYFLQFVYLLKEYAAARGIKASIHMWGYHTNKHEVPSDLRDSVHLYPDLPEEQVIQKLAKFDFVYAMYPMDKKMSIFSSTSLPTKLSSYVQSGRPIFGHAPADSTLTEFLNITGTGVSWSSRDRKSGIEALDKIVNLNVEKEDWENARKGFFGEKNLFVMRDYFKIISNFGYSNNK